MIVNIAAWLYIVQAALLLSSLVLGPFGFGASKETLVTLLFAGLMGAMGVGLLQRHPSARWLALGNSLLGWTFGALALLGIIAALVIAGGAGDYFNSGLLKGLKFFLFIVLLLFVAGVIISFKLFWYLCSREGCEEFGVPYGSSATVWKSVGAWIAIIVADVFLMSGGLLAFAPASTPAASFEEPFRNSPADEREREAELLAEQERARLEAAEAEEAAAAAEQNTAEPSADTPMIEEAEAPVIGLEPRVNLSTEETEQPSANRILKCRDSSGGIAYTQGYCPPGSKEVPASRSE